MIGKTIRKKLHRDDRGSAIVMVVVAIAFIAILIATLFWVSMSNYFMKYTDAKSKETFYSAETVLEEIKAGMQTRASSELLRIYGQSLANYSNSVTEAQVENDYLDAIYGYYRVSPTDPNHFNCDRLIDYIEDQFLPYYGGTTIAAAEHAIPPTGPSTRYEAKLVSPCEIEKTNSKVVLKNVTVQFYDHDTGNYSQITSDLSVNLPTLTFTKTSELPPIFDYAIISDTGVTLENDVEAVLHKNIYAGPFGIQVGENNSVTSSVGAKLDLADAPLAVTRGTVR